MIRKTNELKKAFFVCPVGAFWVFMSIDRFVKGCNFRLSGHCLRSKNGKTARDKVLLEQF